ncbi:hypothetical protein [Bacillus sp. CGMCC 1.16541]|uniref:hypothetical protein n=1 Tax=Bacillus sp. CGMCC 1.16541 TaxID=2185143 RepID=UPI000D7393A6|nr:hypothetical protein [Bacillus sp. CGMCC 1.16541]
MLTIMFYLGALFFFVKVTIDREFIWLMFLVPFFIFILLFETFYFEHLTEVIRIVVFTISFLVSYGMILFYNRYFKKEDD